MNDQPKRGPGRPRKMPESAIHVVPGISEEQLQKAIEPTVEVIYSTQTGQTWPEGNLKVHIYPSFSDNAVGGIARVVEAQVRHLPEFGIEVVDDPEEADVIAYHATVPSTYVKRFPLKPFVSICHGMYWSEYEWDKWAIKANADVMEGIRVADSVVTCSDWVANSIRRHTSRPVRVIPHGIEFAEWNAKDPLQYVLWNKSRPDPVCDPAPMNEVAAKLPDVQFISTFGKETPNVKIVGELEFAVSKAAIERAGVYLCTARETFGIGTLEAMACGIPVVGFNFGGQAEFIEHKVDGWLARPGDVDGLAEGIRWALANRAEISLRAASKASLYTWESACAQYAEVFREAYANKDRNAPRTSIIVTAYKLEKYIDACLESVRAQSDDNWECIIVDDSSPDSCGEIAESWAARDSRFRVIHNEKNQYLAEARNIGIRAARGRYIIPLDADDMLPPAAVGILADALDADRSIHVTYGGVYFVEEDGLPSEYGQEPGKSKWPFPFRHEQQIQQMNLLPYSSMYRREAWEWTGGYRRRCQTAEDADLWTRLSSYGFRPKMVSTEPCLIYRNREGSMSRMRSTNWIRWFSWSKLPSITPAGAGTAEQLPIPSLDPIQVSVIIPVGPGHERIFTDAIDSVDAQSFRNWECIVVNDTGAPITSELPTWVKLIDTGGQTGVAHARNVGIAASKGTVFLPLDADDYLQPDALHMMYNFHKETQAVIYSDFWQDTGTKPNIHETDSYDPTLITGRKRMVNGVQREGMLHSVTAMTPKIYWQMLGGYDEKLPAWEDWDFQIALGNIGVCSNRVAMPLFFYRKHTGFRREENYSFFEKSKEAIMEKWGSLWKGGKELMACSSCRGKSRTLGGTSSPMTAPVKLDGGEAQLVVYNGDKAGNISYRGQSRTIYLFSKGETKYVLNEDIPMFLARAGFSIVQPAVEAPVEPVLTVD